MLGALQSVANALDAATRNQEIVAENLAHVVTPGYRRQGLVFEVLSPTAQDSRNVQDRVPYTHFEAGPMQQTNSPLDLALVGDGFFVLNGPTGPVYTRNGTFDLSPTGQLLSHGGAYPLSAGGGAALQLPLNTSQFTVGGDGTVSANGIQIGRVQIASFARPGELRRAGTTLFEGADPQTPPPGTVRIEQGYREGSNVQPVQEMVSMMIGMRTYEAAQKALHAIADSVGLNTRPQA